MLQLLQRAFKRFGSQFDITTIFTPPILHNYDFFLPFARAGVVVHMNDNSRNIQLCSIVSQTLPIKRNHRVGRVTGRVHLKIGLTTKRHLRHFYQDGCSQSPHNKL